MPTYGYKHVYLAYCQACNILISGRCMKADRLHDSETFISTDDIIGAEYFPEDMARILNAERYHHHRHQGAPVTTFTIVGWETPSPSSPSGRGSCACKSRDIGCANCGNLLGYHIEQPCNSCLSSSNNGHFWILFQSSINLIQRINENHPDGLLWKDLDADKEERLLEETIAR